MTPRPRLIEVAHASPGRLRLRLRWLRDEREAAVGLADRLARLPGIGEVAVRPWTGSVLCSFDARRLYAERIIAAVRRQTRVAAVRRPGDARPPPVARRPAEVASGVRRAISELAKEFDAAVVDATDGHLDLGALAGLGFLGLGAAEIAVSRQLPVPPWFNLAWWAFRTLTISEPNGDRRRKAARPARRRPRPRRRSAAGTDAG